MSERMSTDGLRAAEKDFSDSLETLRELGDEFLNGTIQVYIAENISVSLSQLLKLFQENEIGKIDDLDTHCFTLLIERVRNRMKGLPDGAWLDIELEFSNIYRALSKKSSVQSILLTIISKNDLKNLVSDKKNVDDIAEKSVNDLVKSFLNSLKKITYKINTTSDLLQRINEEREKRAMSLSSLQTAFEES